MCVRACFFFIATFFLFSPAIADTLKTCEAVIPEHCDRERIAKLCSLPKAARQPAAQWSYLLRSDGQYCEGVDAVPLAFSDNNPLVEILSLTARTAKLDRFARIASISAPWTSGEVFVHGRLNGSGIGYNFDGRIEQGSKIEWDLEPVVIERGIPVEWVAFYGYLQEKMSYTPVLVTAGDTKPDKLSELVLTVEFKNPQLGARWRIVQARSGFCAQATADYNEIGNSGGLQKSFEINLDLSSFEDFCVQVAGNLDTAPQSGSSATPERLFHISISEPKG